MIVYFKLYKFIKIFPIYDGLKGEMARLGYELRMTYDVAEVKSGTIVVFIKYADYDDCVFLREKGCKIVVFTADLFRPFAFEKKYIVPCERGTGDESWPFMNHYVRINNEVGIDAFIVFSESSANRYGGFFGATPFKVFGIPHDPRIAVGKRKPDGFNLGYFGLEVNAAFLKEIPVEFFDTGSFNGPKTGWFDFPSSFHCHYAVRPYSLDYLTKPPAKLSIAAYCGSNIILGREESFLELLDESYPFYVDYDLDSILGGIEYARSVFGTDVWRRAESMLEQVRCKCSFETVSSQFVELFNELESSIER